MMRRMPRTIASNKNIESNSCDDSKLYKQQPDSNSIILTTNLDKLIKETAIQGNAVKNSDNHQQISITNISAVNPSYQLSLTPHQS